MQSKPVNSHFPDVRTRIWHEDVFFKFMKDHGFMNLTENEIMVLILTWNHAVEHSTILHSIEDLEKEKKE